MALICGLEYGAFSEPPYGPSLCSIHQHHVAWCHMCNTAQGCVNIDCENPAVLWIEDRFLRSALPFPVCVDHFNETIAAAHRMWQTWDTGDNTGTLPLIRRHRR